MRVVPGMAMSRLVSARSAAENPPGGRGGLDQVISRRTALLGFGGVLAAVVAAPTLVAATSEIEDHYGETALMHTVINEIRASHGLAPLARSVGLDNAAHAHSFDMAGNDFFAHASSDGTDTFTRMQRFYPYATGLGETIGAGYQDAADVVWAWWNSSAHRDILLGDSFTAVGLACAVHHGTQFGWYWTADFGGVTD